MTVPLVGAVLTALVVAVFAFRRFRRRRQAASPRPASAARPQRAAVPTGNAGTVPAFRAILRVAVAAVLLVALVALVVNYEHARDVAARNGEEWRQWLYPLASDGLILSASLVMLVRRLLGLTGGPLAWTAFGAGIAASAATNIAHAVHQGGDAAQLAERIVVSAWPTVALLVAHEMLMQLVAHFAGEKMRQAAATTAPLAAQHTGVPTAAAARAVDAAELVVDGTVPPATNPADRVPNGTARGTGNLADVAAKRAAAQAEARRARAAGTPHTGKTLGARFGMSERWGRLQLEAIEHEHQADEADGEQLAAASATTS